MANKDQPQGARPHGELKRVQPYIAGSAVYPGEFVSIATDGQIDAWASGAVLGVALNKATAAGDVVQVADEPSQLFVIQADSGTSLASTDVSGNFDIVATAEDTTYKIARMELDSSSIATTATLPLKLLGKVNEPSNDWGEHVDCVVKINNHVLSGGTGTAGLA